MTVGRQRPYKILQLNALHNCHQHLSNTIRTQIVVAIVVIFALNFRTHMYRVGQKSKLLYCGRLFQKLDDNPSDKYFSVIL